MKKIVSVILALSMLMVGFSALAAKDDFVESIGYKDGPTLVDDEGVVGQITDEDGNIISEEHEDCIDITPISEANEDEHKDLLDIYDELNEPGKKISDVIDGLEDDNWVVRDLFDISSDCEDLNRELPKDGTSIDLTFDLNLKAASGIKGMIYANGKWTPLAIKENGDGTITATFDHFGQVAFLMPGNVEASPNVPQTGDSSNVVLYGALMALSFAGILLVVLRKKENA